MRQHKNEVKKAFCVENNLTQTKPRCFLYVYVRASDEKYFFHPKQSRFEEQRLDGEKSTRSLNSMPTPNNNIIFCVDIDDAYIRSVFLTLSLHHSKAIHID